MYIETQHYFLSICFLISQDGNITNYNSNFMHWKNNQKSHSKIMCNKNINVQKCKKFIDDMFTTYPKGYRHYHP